MGEDVVQLENEGKGMQISVGRLMDDESILC
jgi:hypothetical protein